MLSYICTVLAKYNYLPANYSVVSIHAQLDKLIFDSLDNEALLPAVKEINIAFGLDPNNMLKDLEPDTGPYCEVMDITLESNCRNKKCRHWEKGTEWNCEKLGCKELDGYEVHNSVQQLNRSINFLEDLVEADFNVIANIPRCIRCLNKANLVNYNGYNVCKICSSGNYTQTLGYVLEARVGRPVKDILNYVIRVWPTSQLQSKVLGLSPENFQKLCSLYNINVKKFRQVGDLRFINPFLNRRKGRPLVDGYLFRLYSLHLKVLQVEKVRPEVYKLRNFLLSEANKLLAPRNLPVFDIFANTESN